jgi:hypothetical protein
VVRNEFILAGCLLVGLGLIATLIGWGQIQTTPLEQLAGLAGALSNTAVPPELTPPKTTGYIVLSGGLCSVLVGLVFIVKSRTDTR